MQERDNDRLEEFFRKAVARPQVSFEEADWRKLEARLDAEDFRNPPAGSRWETFGVGADIGALALLALMWVGARWFTPESTPGVTRAATEQRTAARESLSERPSGARDRSGETTVLELSPPIESGRRSSAGNFQEPPANEVRLTEQGAPAKPTSIARNGQAEIKEVETHKREDELGPPIVTDINRHKQEAIVKLPGAGEEDNAVTQAMVKVENDSRKKESPGASRLSLLLTFAPDFSGTGLNYRSSPGRAFGGLVEYRVSPRWSAYGGVVLNYKEYTGNGEDYTPPSGYWKYYTNGVVPETVHGSCNVLEFPIAVRYEVASGDKGRWTTSLGTSSYLMSNEAYRYQFAQPNPGAKESWSSDGSSRFLFNMMNFTIAYERYVLPGLALGVEPYLKVPLEGIGWPKVKLYSTGFSVTARYNLLHKGRPPN